MLDETENAIAFARASERLRQETATFDEMARQSRQWFRLRLWVGIVAIATLVFVLGLSGYVIIANGKFPPGVYWIAVVGLLGDVLAIATLVFKVILAPESKASLAPVTK